MTRLTQHDIQDGLQAMGLGRGDRILLHASLRSLGWVEGGPDAVIDALVATVGPSGTVLFPTLSFSSINEAHPTFDVRNTPSDTGLITEVARKRPEAWRSEHPFSSAAAIGADAVMMTSHHHDTPCGPTSPYGRLLELGGVSLFIGTDFGCNTMFHVAEEVAAPAYLRYKTFPDVQVTTVAGEQLALTVRRYDCYQTGIKRYLANMFEIYQQAGVIKTGTIGDATCYLISAADNVGLGVHLLQTRPEYILQPPVTHTQGAS